MTTGNEFQRPVNDHRFPRIVRFLDNVGEQALFSILGPMYVHPPESPMHETSAIAFEASSESLAEDARDELSSR